MDGAAFFPISSTKNGLSVDNPIIFTVTSTNQGVFVDDRSFFKILSTKRDHLVDRKPRCVQGGHLSWAWDGGGGCVLVGKDKKGYFGGLEGIKFGLNGSRS